MDALPERVQAAEGQLRKVKYHSVHVFHFIIIPFEVVIFLYILFYSVIQF